MWNLREQNFTIVSAPFILTFYFNWPSLLLVEVIKSAGTGKNANMSRWNRQICKYAMPTGHLNFHVLRDAVIICAAMEVHIEV